jgi:phosphoglycerate dehydrogenase-like enzyme
MVKVLFVPNGSVLTELTDQHRDQIRAAAGEECEIVTAAQPADQVIHARDADFVFGELGPEAFAVAERLQWLQGMGAGGGRMLYPAFRDSPIPFASNKGQVGEQVAEHAFGLLLSLSRGIAAAARRRSWLPDQRLYRKYMWELTGLTMGVLGLGGIGRAVARRADAFGMRVVAVTPSLVEPLPYVGEVWGTDRFADLLALSDVLTICCPLTPATEGLFDRAAFEQMKRTAVLINVTRGQIMVEDALVAALQEGLIRGVALDVAPREPLPQDSPLWQMDNVIITSHTAGASQYTGERALSRFCENLRRWRRGEPLEGLIDKQKGY